MAGALPSAERIPATDGLGASCALSSAGPEAGACLVDRWGRPHLLAARTEVGRRSPSFAVMHPSISRRHALLTLEEGGWWVEELGSRNGTRLDGAPLAGASPVGPGALLQLGSVGFLLAGIPAGVNAALTDPERTATIASDRDAGALPGARLALLAPSRGGGGVLEVDGAEVQLSRIQYALIERLHRQLARDAGQPPEVRGYVPTLELLAELPFETPSPSEANLKQIVRQTRRRLEGSGVTLAARRGFGYRLWTVT